MNFARGLFLWSLCLASTFLLGQSFTLDQALSAPFNSELTAAPIGGTFAWVTNLQGRRNLWAATRNADGKTYSSQQLTKYSEDDGIEIGNIAWTPDGQSLVYVRGGDFEFPERPAPNPDLLSDGVNQEIWVVSVHGGEPRKLATGMAPAVSPVGDEIAYLLKGQIWEMSLKDPNAKPEQLMHTRGTLSSLLWSPNGKALAFVSDRGDHSFIGLYTPETKSLRYLDPGTDHDGSPAWSLDGKNIAFVRVPYSKHEALFGPKRTGLPWSIRVVEAESGKGHEIWRANEGRGSVFHEAQGQSQLHWTSAGAIIFPWEADGWLHLYSVSPNRETAELLTPGDFEVDRVAGSRDGKSIIYSSNQDDIDRRHIWKLDSASGHVSEITHGEGIETAPVVSGDGESIAVLRSDARVPIRPAIVGVNGDLEDLAPQAKFPAASFVVPQQVIFSSADGFRIHGQLFLSKSTQDGRRHPAIVFFHGGSRRQMFLGWHPMEYYSNAYGMNQYLASLGYIVLSVNYRSGIGYGEEFREALNYGATGASEFNDVLGAGLYLRGRSDVDAAHIGVWGGSYGGYLTALALARASDMFAAGVDMHGVHDWNLELGNWLPAYDPAADPQGARTAWLSSPLSSVNTWRSPVLLIQGDDDRNVVFAQTVQLAEALRKQKVEIDELIFPDEIHDFLLHRDWLAAYSASAEFFAKHLK
ncbi:S9 family peptidase [Alloacidobacterium dinghuense]|uniref:Acyl-peptide hydrolase n=1 Tax=Alloacidobacterium dinghuense TaxID=2763107 RepID=A0A7G8BNL6_9BACT|nr:prolyl oligopeptidase family serine peptidase [Alloacidobacterium dinghuense]QNI34136.1 S9 family peptidase [Alloacidobacterium dinghuense]